MEGVKYVPKKDRATPAKKNPKNSGKTQKKKEIVVEDLPSEKRKIPLEDFQKFRKEEFTEDYLGCINVCCFKDTFDAQESLIGQESVYSTFGIHPHDAHKYTPEIEERIVKNMKYPTTVAWGECGLDYFKSQASVEAQQDCFTKQMKRAVQLQKPLVVHSRDAEDDTYRIMTEALPSDYSIHLHCFTGSEEFASKMMNAFPSLCIGFTGAISFPSAENTRKVVRMVPIERIVLETDGPFMAPVPFRGQAAHPGMIPRVAAVVAKEKGLDLKTVLEHSVKNTQRIYRCFPQVEKKE